ncbi:hypothetical protein ASG01_14225 [Chryseobacterium sp. Leaf180]|uniref:TonB-dependent receptor domain-containing protein n=1 Tax=Chryseobacterium sp. Leaf180 TaxID=1736289 RepID=UPI0007022DB1|nr:TonB-dependent receptor [Chryseobacterium sp. Leaf180]KQR91519.1 hypothetical protein ASG01_14225 [Chryseobacterium sp. Leaf180]
MSQTKTTTSAFTKTLSIFIFFFSLSAVAQEFKISGTVSDSQNQKITSAEIYLYTPNNELVKTSLLQNGVFEFSNLKPEQYFLQIQSGDFIQKEHVFELSQDRTFNITLSEKISDIEEVRLSAKRKPFQVQNGNITIDIASSPLNTVATSADLLAKLPFIYVDANGEGLSMIGKGVPLLYVDNQRVDFTTLTSISVDDIKSVEIIRNPSAKYEAEGKAVLKIILKSSKKEGYKLTLNETATFNKRFSNNLSANFQQKKNKTEWKMNAAYNQIQHWESNGFDYLVPSRDIKSDYIIKSITDRPQIILGTNIFHQLSDTDDFTFAVNANLRPDKGTNTTVTNYEANGAKSQIVTLNNQDSQRATVNSVFNYNRKLKSLNATLFAGLQFTRESQNVGYDFYNNVDNAGFLFSQFRKNKYGANAYSGRIDVEKKFKKDYVLGFGASFTKADVLTNNLTDYKSLTPSEYFKYIFSEENIASYAEFSGEKEKFSFKGGLRMETTSAKGINRILNLTNIDRHFTDWFPSAKLSFRQNKDYEYSLNFNRNISRPGYGDLASGGLYGSPYVEYQGNPNLLPTYTTTVSANANLKKWALNASVYESKNPTGFGLFYDETKNISVFTVKNFDREIGASIGLDVPFEYKFLTSQNSISVNYSRTEDRLAVVSPSTPYLYVYSNNTLKLGKGFTALLDGSWVTRRVQGLYEYNQMIIVNVGLTKSVSGFDFTVRYNDIFRQNIFIQKLSYGKIITKGSFYGNTPVFSIGVKYNFGKVSNSGYKEKAINETVDRI